jgi:BolA family transcriptional regulator, general stress-responsive regulator
VTAAGPAAGASRAERIRSRLQQALQAEQIELIDDSHHHAGHAGAQDGRGHFRVRIVASAFADLRPLQRHQLVYRSLGELMQTDIHALSITALTPQEADHAAP